MFFNMQRWSLHDGPGIRTTLFFKGCPLRCRWCSNPESWSYRKELFFWQSRCSGCEKCTAICTVNANSFENGRSNYNRRRCVQCGCCSEACPQNARVLVGHEMSLDTLAGLLEKDAVFYRSSGGGVTFSGGEPFGQLELLKQVARRCSRAGIRTAVETCGYFELADAIEIFEYIDGIFFDLKHTNDRKHKALTGASNQKIIANLIRLDELGYPVTIRIPLISGLTDTKENIGGIVKLCSRLRNLLAIELLSYHDLGAGKYPGLDLCYKVDMDSPQQQTVESISEQIRSAGIRVNSHC